MQEYNSQNISVVDHLKNIWTKYDSSICKLRCFTFTSTFLEPPKIRKKDAVTIVTGGIKRD